jgi:type II secretory pathway pseudopilin PulG
MFKDEPMNKKARSFLVIILIIAFTSLFLRFFVLWVINITIAQNQSAAEETLKLIATAIENYSKDHAGAYPSHIEALIQNNPAYIDSEYIKDSSKGYIYSWPRIEESGYSCTAVPKSCILTGKKIYKITTGGVFVSEDCGK